MLTVQNRLLLGEISRHVNRLIPMPIDLEMETEGWITVHESYARTSSTADLLPNATQHKACLRLYFLIRCKHLLN
ncbi:MAG: hypothetical protein ACFNS5_10050, partial [Prevotella melaninogenica]